jgi:hypothetical protein
MDRLVSGDVQLGIALVNGAEQAAEDEPAGPGIVRVSVLEGVVGGFGRQQAAKKTEGKACPQKPCSDYCRFSEPNCMTGLGEEEIWSQVYPFLAPRGPAGLRSSRPCSRC